MTTTTTVIVFSHLRWSSTWQRPQQLLSQLGKHVRVLYIEEPVLDDAAPHLVCTMHSSHVQVVVPHTPVRAAGFHDDQLPVLQRLLDGLLQPQHDVVAWFCTPMALPLMARMRPRLVVYDRMDNLAADDAAGQLQQREGALLKRADLVLTGGPSLYEATRALHPHVHYLPNAVDAAHFAPADVVVDDAHADAAERLLHDVPRPRLGYFGTIDARIDLSLLQALAQAQPLWQLMMAGPVVGIDSARLPRAPNIHWLGALPHSVLPHLMAGWDACLLPLMNDESTRLCNPLQTLEYLAGEKPVISTAVPDVVSLYGDLVRLGHGAPDFAAAGRALLVETAWQRAERLARALPTVLRQTWSQHGKFVSQLLQAHLVQRARVLPAHVVAPISIEPTTSDAEVTEPLPASRRRAAAEATARAA